MVFRNKRTGAIGETNNPVLIEMRLRNTEVYEVVESEPKAPIERQVRKSKDNK